MSLTKKNNLGQVEETILKHLSSMRSDFLHPYIGIKLRAYQKTLDFIEANIADAVVCNNRNEVFNYALKHIDSDGIVAEFGVKSGTTINELANKPILRKKTIYLSMYFMISMRETGFYDLDARNRFLKNRFF